MNYLKFQGGRIFFLLRVMSFYALVITIILLEVPCKVDSFTYFTPPTYLEESSKFYLYGEVFPPTINGSNLEVAPEVRAELVSIAQLLSSPSRYHRETVKVRGIVTQPELHIDETGLFIRFVFVLKDSQHTLVVFGHHDRTQGNLQIETAEKVEVMGVFWKERTANNHHFQNNLEAITVSKYPPLHPEAT